MKKNVVLIFTLLLYFQTGGFAQQEEDKPRGLHVPMGICSEPPNAEVQLKLEHRFQQFQYAPKGKNDHYDRSIYSPKSASFSQDGSKFYVHSLEGFTTTVYCARKMKRLKVINHDFGEKDSLLFKDGATTIYDYPYFQEREHYNHFKGKPVESCLSHQGRYLWVSYYRRDFDPVAVSPSAIAIIDTQSDSIVRVMPTGPLPKMVACSPDNKYLAVTHWGDNTVGLIDISSDSVQNFAYVKHIVIDYKAQNNFAEGKYVNRDRACGNCLRGTVFSPDSRFLLVGKMGGKGIAVVTLDSLHYRGTITGMKTNVRHLIVEDEHLILSSNRSGYVQRAPLAILLDSISSTDNNEILYRKWQNRYVGVGARTIEADTSGQYIFAAVNNGMKVVAVRTRDMKVVAEIDADAYPVGMAVSPDNRWLVITSQGKKLQGGNSVMVYSIDIPQFQSHNRESSPVDEQGIIH